MTVHLSHQLVIVFNLLPQSSSNTKISSCLLAVSVHPMMLITAPHLVNPTGPSCSIYMLILECGRAGSAHLGTYGMACNLGGHRRVSGGIICSTVYISY